ncbi:hypothetical protein KR032_003627 [Drosophila birchii]|nr:hypothetical protein KR032_003627 [Drosophila birchii]
MKLSRNLTFGLIILIGVITVGLEARRLVLRPLTRRELRNALDESGIGSESAAGKSVSSAFAGLSGFALGITKGIGGSILFDVVTSNVTIDYITSLLNSTASSTSSNGTAQEICFNSRSVDGEVINGRSNNDANVDDSVYPSGEWRQTTMTTTPTSATTPTTTPSTPTTSTPGVTCIVLGSKGYRRRRLLEISPGTLPHRPSNRLRKYRRNRF